MTRRGAGRPDRERPGARRRERRGRRAQRCADGGGGPSGEVTLNPTGNPGMATGGTGDVLTGIAGGFLAQGLAAHPALRAAVYLHGLAGDLAARARGGVGLPGARQRLQEVLEQVLHINNALLQGAPRRPARARPGHPRARGGTPPPGARGAPPDPGPGSRPRSPSGRPRCRPSRAPDSRSGSASSPRWAPPPRCARP